jgi:hypothetical protein
MGSLSRNTLRHIKSVVSAIFTLAKQQDYFHAENPARDTAINPSAAEPQETYAYSFEEIHTINLAATRACGYSVCNSGLHGVTARRDSRTAMGELSKRRNASLSFNLERAA